MNSKEHKVWVFVRVASIWVQRKHNIIFRNHKINAKEIFNLTQVSAMDLD